ncbi:MFS transporter [Sphingomonas sp. CA1-15]|uniref:MFS transporter n=2 Tax=Sphingomonas immobilis TaxID=3063997 RepID=A0ABT8ZZ88_9SPHN|nr:MFS transporter [Sphingomonas sp. CA1-15]
MIIALWVAEMTQAFGTAMLYAGLKALIATFKDPVLVGWLVTTYLLVGAGAAAVAGRLGDLFGRRRVLLILLALSVTGSIINAVSTSFAVLIAGRVLEGLAGAILPLCVGLVRENVSKERVPMAIGLMISGASAGTAAGLVIGGMLVDLYSWHALFVASASFAALAFVLIRLCLPPSPLQPRTAPLDWLGGLLFVPATLALLLAISSGPKWGIGDPRTIATLIGGAALFAVWIRQSLKAVDPMFDVRLFRNRQVLVANLATALVSMSTLQITLVFSVMLQAPKWTMVGLGVSATLAGLVKLPSNISSLFAGPLSGWLTQRGGGRMVMVAGGLLTSAGWLLAMAFHDSILIIGLILIVISFGATMLFAVGPTILVDAVPHDRTSEAAGMMTVVRQASLGIGAQIVTLLLATSTVVAPEGGARYPTVGAFMLTMGVIVAISLVATALAFALPKGKPVAAV